MILTVIFEGISKAATVLPVLMKVCTIPHHDTGYLYVVLVLQSCSDPLHILPSSSCQTNATSGRFPDINSEPDTVSYICVWCVFECVGVWCVLCVCECVGVCCVCICDMCVSVGVVCVGVCDVCVCMWCMCVVCGCVV